MHVEDLKRWHWILAGIVVGLVIGYVWSSMEWEEAVPTIGQQEFEQGILLKYAQNGCLTNVIVMPPVDGRYRIVADRMRNTRTPGLMDLERVAYISPSPYNAGAWRGETNNTFPNVLNYLERLKKLNPDVQFNYNWSREPKSIYAVWVTTCVLIIGGVWPSVISLMTGGGLGLVRQKEEKEYDLSRFKGTPEPAKKGPAGPTAADIEHLRQLEEELEKKLAAKAMGLPIPEDQPQPMPAAVRKLDGGPLQSVAPEKPQEEHEFSGEFYPVDHGVKKKH